MAAKLIDAEIRSTCAGMGSTMGKQIPSTRKTAPAVSFGTADKSANPKIFISTEHNATFYGAHSPGAKYRVHRAMSHTTHGGSTPPSYSFGSGKRHDFTEGGELKSPGPAKYSVKSATFGEQVLSSYKSQSGSRMGKATRDQATRASLSKDMAASPNFANKNSPGPCAYTLAVSLGRSGSTQGGGMEPKPVWGTGTEPRFRMHSGMQSGSDETPGPATAVFSDGMGPQVLARYRSAPVVGFGKGDSRANTFAAEARRSPGPIYYPKWPITGTRNPPKFSFGTSTRDSYARRGYGASSPGPGAYNVV